MTPEELDEARAKEAVRIWSSQPLPSGEVSAPAAIAARLARENWTPPEPVDPDVLAWREWAAMTYPSEAKNISAGSWDKMSEAYAFLAGARMAREQEQERANHPIAFAVRVMAGVFKDLDHAKREARATLAKCRGEA